MSRTQLVFLLLCITTFGCTTFHPPAAIGDREQTPAGLADELRQSVTHLAGDIGERNCYRPAKLSEAADWIESQFIDMGYVTRRVPVDVPAGAPFFCGRQRVFNIEADKPGTDLANEVVVIGAHYDSKVAMDNWHDAGPPTPARPGTPGADDNASGIAGVLAVARMLKDVPLRRTVKFAAFVNEEPPFFETDSMGSLAYANALAREFELHASLHGRDPRRRVVGMISFEMLGFYDQSEQKKRPFGIGVTGLPANTDYIAILSNIGSSEFAITAGNFFSRRASIAVRVARLPIVVEPLAWSDDWSFWQIGSPAIAVSDTAFLRNDNYHDVSDTPNTLNYPRMADTVASLRALVADLANENVRPVKHD